jgi:hypothetical protein
MNKIMVGEISGSKTASMNMAVFKIMVVASQSFKLMQERDEEASMKLDRVGQ